MFVAAELVGIATGTTWLCSWQPQSEPPIIAVSWSKGLSLYGHEDGFVAGRLLVTQEEAALWGPVAWPWEFIPEKSTLSLSSALSNPLGHLIPIMNPISASTS